MKLSKSTIDKCRKALINVYTAKKVTNKHGEWIIITYATRYMKDGVCTAVSTTKEVTIEGSTQEDIVNHFETLRFLFLQIYAQDGDVISR